MGLCELEWELGESSSQQFEKNYNFCSSFCPILNLSLLVNCDKGAVIFDKKSMKACKSKKK
jgi:hypothetical protein